MLVGEVELPIVTNSVDEMREFEKLPLAQLVACDVGMVCVDGAEPAVAEQGSGRIVVGTEELDRFDDDIGLVRLQHTGPRPRTR